MFVQTVSPIALLASLDDSVDNHWGDQEDWIERLLEYKFDDTSERRLDDFARGIKNPICVCVNGTTGMRGWILGNGHHRLAFAILACLDDIDVVFTEDGEYMVSHITDQDDWLVQVDWWNRA